MLHFYGPVHADQIPRQGLEVPMAVPTVASVVVMDSDAKGICEANTVPKGWAPPLCISLALGLDFTISFVKDSAVFACFWKGFAKWMWPPPISPAALHWYPAALTFPEPALGPALFLGGVTAIRAERLCYDVCDGEYSGLCGLWASKQPKFTVDISRESPLPLLSLYPSSVACSVPSGRS